MEKYNFCINSVTTKVSAEMGIHMKRLFRMVALFMTLVLMLAVIMPETEAGTLNSEGRLEAEAATLTDAIGQYVLNIGSEYYRQNSEIVLDRDMTIQMMYVDESGTVLPISVASGSSITIEWNVVDDNNIDNDTVFTAKGVSKNVSGLLNYCELKVNGVGYSNLTARVTIEDTVLGETQFIDYSWKFQVKLAIDSSNIINDDGYDSGEYGLRYAFSTDKSRSTLQISGPEVLTDSDTTNDKYNKYLLLLKKANLLYSFTNSSGNTVVLDNFSTEKEIEESTILRNLLQEKVVWTTSDSNVVTVKYGVITGVGAGKATITATTSSEDGVSEQSISINVVVKPSGYIVDSSVTPVYENEFKKTVQTNSFTVNTNAVDATKLVWTVYNKNENGDVIWSSDSSRTTDKFKIDIYNTSGSAYFSKVKAGTYYVTVRVSNEYSENNTNIGKMKFTVTVPVNVASGPIYMNVSDVYDILENSSIPVKGWYNYSSSDSGVASVLNGIITGEGNGTAVITLNRIEGSGYADVFSSTNIDTNVPVSKTIEVRVIDSIYLNYSSSIIYTNATLNLIAYTSNNTVIQWTSSDASIATVDDSGLVTGVKAGTAVITATQNVNGVKKSAYCQITVRQSVSSITLAPSQKDIALGDNLTINATVSPSLNGVSLKWVSSDEKVIKISTSGDLSTTVTAVAGGTAVVTAINQENVVVGSCLINVYEPISGITLSQTSVVLPLSEGWFQLYSTIMPSSAENQEVIWSSTDKTVATVDANGIVTLKTAGKTSIIATSRTDASISAICNLEVTKSVTGIKLDATTHDMYVGETFRLTFTISPVGASNAVVTWTSSNTSVANVDANGLVTSKGVGTAVILAKTSDGGYTATCTVNVGRVATAVKLDVTKLTLNAGDYYYLDATLTPADTTETTVTYETSDTSVAIVSKKGKITAKKAGACVVMAKTRSGSMAYCAVTVLQSVTGIVISESTLELSVGESYELSADIIPGTASNNGVTWSSSNTDVLTVDEKGEVDALLGGTAIITCKSDEGGFMDFCVVTVIEEVTELVLDYNYYKLGINETFKLTATISGETATNKEVEWYSSDSDIVSVDNNGRMRGIAMGYATIICEATDGSGAMDTCEVRVCRLVSNIELDVTYITLIQGHSYSLNARVYPSDATYADAVWKSDDSKIALVDQQGVITALSPGNTIIHAEANDSSGVSAVCYVNVIAPVSATNISLAESEVVLSPGETKTVSFSLVPNNTTETVTWSSDNTVVATVDKDTGKITAGEIGSANITIMTESGRKGTIKVFVVGLSRSYVELQQYTSLLLKLEVDGSGSSNFTVRWDVDNQDIATVANGRVTAKAVGTTTVYAVVNGRRLACVIKVIKIK